MRGVKWLIPVALLAGALVYLESRAGERPVARVEKPVSLDALGK